MAGVRRVKEVCKNKYFFFLPELFSSTGKKVMLPFHWALGSTPGKALATVGCQELRVPASTPGAQAAVTFCLKWVREQLTEAHLAGGELGLQLEPPEREKNRF